MNGTVFWITKACDGDKPTNLYRRHYSIGEAIEDYEMIYGEKENNRAATRLPLRLRLKNLISYILPHASNGVKEVGRNA